MSTFERWMVYLSTILVGGTGLVYAVMLYAFESNDPFSVVNHPWQPDMQHLHVLFAPFFVFAVGLIWRRHVWEHWSSGKRMARRSGVGLMILLAPMIASGYLLQTAVGEGWRQVWIGVHLVTSAVWSVAFVGHYVVKISRKKSGVQTDAKAEVEKVEGFA